MKRIAFVLALVLSVMAVSLAAQQTRGTRKQVAQQIADANNLKIVFDTNPTGEVINDFNGMVWQQAMSETLIPFAKWYQDRDGVIHVVNFTQYNEWRRNNPAAATRTAVATASDRSARVNAPEQAAEQPQARQPQAAPAQPQMVMAANRQPISHPDDFCGGNFADGLIGCTGAPGNIRMGSQPFFGSFGNFGGYGGYNGYGVNFPRRDRNTPGEGVFWYADCNAFPSDRNCTHGDLRIDGIQERYLQGVDIYINDDNLGPASKYNRWPNKGRALRIGEHQKVQFVRIVDGEEVVVYETQTTIESRYVMKGEPNFLRVDEARMNNAPFRRRIETVVPATESADKVLKRPGGGV